MNIKIFIKIPLVILENVVFSIFPKSRNIIEKYLFNPYAFNENHIVYSQSQFDQFCQKIGGVSQISDKTVLELGPGGSIGFGLLCIKNGAKKYYAIDDGEHTFLTEKQIVFYKKLLKNDELLIKKCFNVKNGEKSYNTALIEFIKISQNSTYDLPDSSIDMIYSCAVLEHVHNLDLCFSEMSRVLRAGGAMNHQVDLRDHIFFQNSLWFLTISDFWFNKLFKNTGEYTNRKRLSDYVALAKKYNLKILKLDRKSFSHSAVSDKLSKVYSKEDLETSSINLTLQKINASRK